MGYAFVTSRCGACGNLFTFHPTYVPSLKNVPFCEDCIKAVNKIRKENGRDELFIHPRAYDIAEEHEI